MISEIISEILNDPRNFKMISEIISEILNDLRNYLGNFK